MDYDALRLFLHLSHTLRFARTSRECHVSPSALSRAVQRLEREAGWPLLERDRRSVRLTPEGTRFAAHARDTLEHWEALQQDLRGRRETLSGTIVVFASVTACQSFLPEMLSGFRQRHPDIHIQLETGYAADALEHLAEGRVDVSVAAVPAQVPRALVARVLLHTPLVFAAPRAACEVERLARRLETKALNGFSHAGSSYAPAAAGTSPTRAVATGQPSPWAEVPFVLPASGQARESADRWFRRRRVVPRVYGELSGSEAILALVSLGCGVGIVPRIVLEESPLAAKVRLLDVDEGGHPLGEFRVGVCTQRKKLASPLVQALWDSLRAG